MEDYSIGNGSVIYVLIRRNKPHFVTA